MELIESYNELNSEFDNTCSITNGMVELVESINKETEMTPNACFANTVLVLDDVDLPSLAGQESFWDGVKKGTTKVYEWIKQLIKTFREWFNGKSKRQYDEASKRVEKDFGDTEKVMEAAIKIIMTDAPRPVKDVTPAVQPKYTAMLRRLDGPDAVKVKEKFKEVILEAEEAGKIDKSLDEAFEAIYSKVKNSLSAIATQIKELDRIDETREASKSIGVSTSFSSDISTIDSFIANTTTLSSDKRLKGLAKSIVTNANIAQTMSARAAVEVEKMNNKAMGNPDQGVQSKLSRAVSVMKIVTEIAARYRDLVIDMDTAMLRAGGKIADTALRNALIESMSEVSERSAEYMQRAMDELGM